MDTQLVTSKDVCKLLSISRSTLDNWMVKKGLPFVKVGRLLRFDIKKVMEWLHENG